MPNEESSVEYRPQTRGGDNQNLINAQQAGNDEFYTQLQDIEVEVFHYKKHFKGKVVYCNCDDPKASMFYHHFKQKFKTYGLKKLIASTYRNADIDRRRSQQDLLAESQEKYNTKQAEKKNQSPPEVKKRPAVYIEYTGGKTGRPKHMQGDGIYHGGDFRSQQSIELLKQADIVCTNPPFSLFREYVAQLIAYDKKFLIIGNFNALKYQEIFPLIKENKIWTGYSSRGMDFMQPDGEINSVNAVWFTNLEHKKLYEELDLFETYSADKYQKYDNYDAIEVAKVRDIPRDYDGVMGVPITFMDKFNSEQFEIVGYSRMHRDGLLDALKNPKWQDSFSDVFLNGKQLYARIFIRHKRPQTA